MTLIDQTLLDALSTEARQAPRGRKNRNFHPSDDFPAHRLLNAIEPGSYVMPHRHLDPAKGETIVVVRGAVGIVLFDDEGAVTATHRLVAGGEVVGIDLPAGTWHSVLGLQPGSVFFEAKAGPYVAMQAAERAPWAPAEGDAAATAYQTSLAQRFA
ncbi:hypothetical protein OTERR_27130 [Oryzomicrobium terrae]|uniref:Cupin fold metalloprotein WbuC cupin domain-containing protein n=1 Tax=Oryzomicrobium terrae TaxID=1735038 RepID=A0A5C1EC43_9RHOO|nr:WbuC family cupin fold metalloprotein [Oryzomicrobium terrae]QEL66189.1 hypothetical protein OTERR_27130 [Oryzomicrobium terrae]